MANTTFLNPPRWLIPREAREAADMGITPGGIGLTGAIAPISRTTLEDIRNWDTSLLAVERAMRIPPAFMSTGVNAPPNAINATTNTFSSTYAEMLSAPIFEMPPSPVDRVEEELRRYRAKEADRKAYALKNILYHRNDSPVNTNAPYSDDKKFGEKYQSEVILFPWDLTNTFRERNYDGSPATFHFSPVGFDHELYVYISMETSLVLKVYPQEKTVVLWNILPSSDQRREKLKRLFLRHLGFNCVRDKKFLKITYRDRYEIKVPFGSGYSFAGNSRDYSLIGVARR